MDERLVSVRMTVRLWISHWRIPWSMHVLVMRVVHMRVSMLHRFVRVVMLVALGEMKPDAQRHAAGAEQQERSHLLSPSNDRESRADEWRREKYAPVRAVPR